MAKTDAIIVLVPGFPGNEAETDCLPPLQNLVRSLAERNPALAIHVVSFQYPFIAAVYDWHRVTVHAVAGGNKPFPTRLQSWLRTARIVRRLMRSQRVIALHSMWLAECTLVGSWLAWPSGIPHIATIRGQDADPANPYLKYLRLDRMTITAGSEAAAATFRKSTGRYVDHVIPHGIDAVARLRRLEPADRDIDILGVGSLSTIKDFGSFLEIISAVQKAHPNLKCEIAGEGPERPQLEMDIRRLGLERNVTLVGRVAREAVLSMMRRSKILLHTSRYEGQGYVLLEALASGARVVCRDVGYSGNGTGAYRCLSDQEMIDGLNRLLAGPLGTLDVEVIDIEETAAAFEKIYFAQRLQ